jgi:hypothetical protein
VLARIKALNLPAVEPGATIPAAFPLAPRVVAVVQQTTFTQPAPTVLQSLYFIRAVDADGNLSRPSNLVGGPSKAVDVAAPPIAQCAAVTVEAARSTRTAAASIDDGSFDPNNRNIRLVQIPRGPYKVGTTNVTLKVRSRAGTAVCSAEVTVVAPPRPAKPWRPRGRHHHGGRVHDDDRCEVEGDAPDPSRSRVRASR